MSSETQPPSPPSAPALEMIAVDVPGEQGRHSARIKQVDWRVDQGDYWFVGGLHRSGKSDLLAVAAGITPPLSGKVLLFGIDPGAGRPGEVMPEQLRVGLIFDGGRLLHHLTVAENVALPVAYHRDLPLAAAVEEIQPILSLTKVEEWQDYLPGTISRNWQQRAGLARALALHPELLLVDNPLSGLDLPDAHWWLGILHEFSCGHSLYEGRPITLVVAGDTLLPWKDQARQFAVLKDGRLQFPGRGPETFKDQLWEPFLPAELTP